MENNLEKNVAAYFLKTRKIVSLTNLKNKVVLVQFFQRKDNAILCGMDEVLKLLKENTKTEKYEIRYLPEGSKINSGDVVLELEGHYQDFGIYEGIIDGILSRATSIASNAHKVVSVAGKKEVIFMADRSDHYSNHERDGYAASVGGIKTQVTAAHLANHKSIKEPVGTMPHVLIQMHEGNTVEAARTYSQIFPGEKLTVLIDYKNDVIDTSRHLLAEFKSKLHAVRVDTSPALSDNYFVNNEEFGVTPNLIKALRKDMNENGGSHVKIIVSSGFNEEKIKMFEKANAPVDIYGVGASLLKINNTFTCDAVKLDGKEHAKVGRQYNKNTHLKSFKK